MYDPEAPLPKVYEPTREDKLRYTAVYIYRGSFVGSMELDGEEVQRLTAYLFHAGTHNDPKKLNANCDRAFLGSKTYGQGFVFDDNDTKCTPISTAKLLLKDEHNATCIFPYLGGAELNSSPTHAPHRLLIDSSFTSA